MIKNNGFVERRRWDRFRVDDFARVDFTSPPVFDLKKPSVAKYAIIIDINWGGLSFIYESSQIWMNNFDKLSITVDAYKIVAEDLPCQVVSDYLISPQHNATARKCGIRFGELTPTQRFQIDSFIRNHSTYLQAVERQTGIDPGTSNVSLYSYPEKRKMTEGRKYPKQM